MWSRGGLPLRRDSHNVLRLYGSIIAACAVSIPSIDFQLSHNDGGAENQEQEDRSPAY